jgi:hypothetical protein
LSNANTSLVSLLKGPPFVGVLAFFYFHDFLGWYTSIFVFPWIGVFILGVTLSIFGAVSIGRAIEAYAEVSKGSWAAGLITLFGAIGLYIFGSYSMGTFGYWLQYESLLVLVASYILLSYDWRILRATALLFIIAALAFPSPFFLNLFGTEYIFYGTIGAMVVLFIASERSYARAIAGSFVAAGVVIAYYLIPQSISSVVPYVIPLCFLVYAYGALRSNPNSKIGPACSQHRPSGVDSGFCSLCGRRFRASSRSPKSGLIGLAIVILVLILLPTIQIPLMQLSSETTPQYNVYNYRQINVNNLPETPQGWTLNSSNTLNLTEDLFALKNVYSPSQNTLGGNYTLYFELSRASKTNLSSTWSRNVFGWNKTVTPLNFGGLGGTLVIYTSNTTTFIVYFGNMRLTFTEPFSQQVLTLQFSLLRNFSSSVSVPVAASTFVSDLNPWQTELSPLNTGSAWSAFFFSLYSLFNSIFSLLAIIGSSGVVVYIAFRAMQSDSEADRFMTISSELDQAKWLTLSSLIESPYRPRAALDIQKLLLEKKENLDTDEIVNVVKDLENVGLLKKVLWERGSEVFQGWITAVRFGVV